MNQSFLSRTLGPALVDPGSPFTGAVSAVKAASLSAATEMAKGCPLLFAGRQIAVYEMFSAM